MLKVKKLRPPPGKLVVHPEADGSDLCVADTVGSRLSKHRLSEFSIIRTLGRRHVFVSSGKNTFRSLEFCYRRNQSCCMNDFSQMLQRLFQPVRDLDHVLQRPS